MKKNYIVVLCALLMGSFLNAQNMDGVVRDYFKKSATNSSLTAKDLNEWKVTDVIPSLNPQIQHVYVQQIHQGIPVDNGRYKLTVTKGQVSWEINQFVDNLATKSATAKGTLTPESAIMAVVNAHRLRAPLNLSVTAKNQNELIYNNTGISEEPIKVDKVYLYQDDTLYLTWKVNLLQEDGQHWWVSNVDVATGKILRTEDWIISCNFDDPNGEDHNHNHAATEKAAPFVGPTLDAKRATTSALVGGGSYNVYPLGVESPSHGNRAIVTDPANATASPFGWHDTNGSAGAEFTNTRGNNVLAQEDTNGNNGSGATPNGGSSLNFDFPINFNLAPSQFLDAATTNLFYWNNIMHDVWYQYGFNEASGNFQENNYGKGGLGSDSVNADAQDGSGTNNANFGTPPDGSNPRMQMFLFTNPTRDGDFDNVIIAHEYGHGISTRLVGGPGTNALGGSEQMGEGWSDWFGLVMTIRPGDTRNTARGVGTYAIGQPTTGSGIRPTRYSTDFAENGTTYGDIGGLAVPHGVGYGFATILWDMTWDLIDLEGYDADQYNGTGGNNIAMALVIEGLKNTANNPGYVSGRDGILQADQDLYGGQYNCLIWDAFARRGVGVDAAENTNGGTNTNNDQRTSFTSGCAGPPQPTTCNSTVSNLPYNEGFENTIGQWSQDTTDNFDWTVRQGGTPSNGTGPSGAFEGSYYVYVEASNPNFGGLTTTLNSPCFDLSGTSTPTAAFHYQMTGNAVGTVRLEARLDSETTWTQIWTRNGDQGADWIAASVDLSAYAGSSVQLRFRATTADSWQGDIAIDAFGITGSSGPTGDTQAPSTPTNLSVTGVTDTTADLSWNASTDNVGVTGYNVYLDGTLLGNTAGTSVQITGLTAGTTYDFRVEAVDAAGNTSNLSNVATGTTTGGGGGGPLNDVLLGSFFESGLDGWLDGGSDCFRYRGRFSAEGQFSMRLRDNSGSRSAMTTAATYDLSPYDNVTIDFSVYANSMENGEDFFILYDDGSGFQLVESYVSGTDFNNGTFYTASVNISSSQFNLSSTGRFRIQCDASSNQDQVYIDEVVITGTAGFAGFAPTNTLIDTGIRLNDTASFGDQDGFEGDFQVLPNPAKSFTDVRLAIDIEEKPVDVNLNVYDMIGRLVIAKSYPNTTNTVFSERLDVSGLTSGLYFVKVSGSNGMLETYKLMVE